MDTPIKKQWSAPQIIDLDSTLNNTGNQAGTTEGVHRNGHLTTFLPTYSTGTGIYSAPTS